MTTLRKVLDYWTEVKRVVVHNGEPAVKQTCCCCAAPGALPMQLPPENGMSNDPIMFARAREIAMETLHRAEAERTAGGKPIPSPLSGPCWICHEREWSWLVTVAGHSKRVCRECAEKIDTAK